MASEPRRECGYRKVGALYLEGDYHPVECDRLPYQLTICPSCGHGIKFSRTPQAINPVTLFGPHVQCHDHRGCMMCKPADALAFILWIGETFYKPDEFRREAQTMGICRRIQTVPRGLKVRKTVVYLAHIHAVTVPKQPFVLQQAMAVADGIEPEQPRMLDAHKAAPGIFSAFVPKRIVQLVWQSDLTDELREKLEKRGITPKAIPDGDPDHMPNRGRKGSG